MFSMSLWGDEKYKTDMIGIKSKNHKITVTYKLQNE